MIDPRELAVTLGHDFARRTLLETALTHRSFGQPHNERLEFLGDGVLNCVIADLLYARFPELSEGDLSRLRANLVRQDSLHRIAVDLDLGSHLRLGEGEERSGGRQRASMLADAFEALVGAIHLDAGYVSARAVVERLYDSLIVAPGQAMKDAKTRLQEHLQGTRQALPVYALRATLGDAHAQVFEVACELNDLGITTLGRGTSRRQAEQQAAAAALTEIERR